MMTDEKDPINDWEGVGNDPVPRPEEPIVITHLTQTNSGGIPSEWDGLTADHDHVYVRWRSGHLKVKVGGDYGVDGDLVYDVFVGRHFPGTYIQDHEVLELVRAVDFIDLPENPPGVPGDVMQERSDAFIEANDLRHDWEGDDV